MEDHSCRDYFAGGRGRQDENKYSAWLQPRLRFTINIQNSCTGTILARFNLVKVMESSTRLTWTDLNWSKPNAARRYDIQKSLQIPYPRSLSTHNAQQAPGILTSSGNAINVAPSPQTSTSSRETTAPKHCERVQWDAKTKTFNRHWPPQAVKRTN